MSTTYLLNRQRRRNIARTALFILTKVDPKQFDMRSYSSDGYGPWELQHKGLAVLNECGTACCFAGWAPVALKNVKAPAMGGWSSFIHTHLLGNEAIDYALEEFLFSGEWPSDPVQTAKRALVALENTHPYLKKVKAVDKEGDSDYWVNHSVRIPKFHTKLNKTDLIERLRQFTK